jgi:hypothetical protein
MLHFNPLPAALLGLALLASCTPRYLQIVQLHSDDVALTPERELVFENDTLRIEYDFYSENGVLRFRVLNKLAQPLYVRWDKSSYIVGQQFENYWENRSVSAGDISYGGDRSDELYLVTAHDQSSSFIPPQTGLARDEFIVKPGRAFLPGQLRGGQLELETDGAAKSRRKVLHYRFDAAGSPVYFRHYLTFSTDADGRQLFYVDHAFWASDIIEAPFRQVFGDPYVNSDYWTGLLQQRAPKRHRWLGPHTFVLRPAVEPPAGLPPARMQGASSSY